MKILILVISIICLGLVSCKKEEIKPKPIKYKHPVAPDRIAPDSMPPLILHTK